MRFLYFGVSLGIFFAFGISSGVFNDLPGLIDQINEEFFMNIPDWLLVLFSFFLFGIFLRFIFSYFK